MTVPAGHGLVRAYDTETCWEKIVSVPLALTD
jgi:hypothetical protein